MTPARAKRADSPLGATLRRARERAGLGMRELAGLLEVSPATISDAEAGGDPRRSTLLRYLEKLPALTAHDLVGHGAPGVPRQGAPAWGFMRDAFGFAVARLTYEVTVGAGDRRRTRLEAHEIRPSRGELRDAAILARVMHLTFAGSSAARAGLDPQALLDRGELRVEDGSFAHVFRLARQTGRHGLAYLREQGDGAPPAGFGAPGALSVSAPFPAGISLPIDLPVEELDLVVKFETDVPLHPRCAAWAVQLALAPDERDLASLLHPGDVEVERAPRSRTLKARVKRPVLGLHYGLGWGGDSGAERPGRASSGSALRDARNRAGLTVRDLAKRVGVSPATIVGAERGQDVRASLLSECLAALPGLSPEALLPSSDATGPFDRRDAWELQRRVLGIDAEEERKTLQVTPEGDAHAACETLGLRRVRPSDRDLRVRYSSVQVLGKRFPTVLKAIEDAVAERAQESGLRARVVERREGRLIHEIVVPRELAQVGVSYARRLFDEGFFAAREEPGGKPRPRIDGAAIVPFHPVRRLVLTITLPPGAFPRTAWFGVHPHLRLEGPLPEADLAAQLHPDGLECLLLPKERTIRLVADHPLVGFIYDVFWESG
jgi:transcriptional regulator with XRE-family HTH domain